MIRVTIELIPGGIGDPQHLHTIDIWNDMVETKHDRSKGSYRYLIGRKGARVFGPLRGEEKKGRGGRITGFPRQRLSAVRLLQRVLNDAYPKGS
jgi:hypothetical protein